MNNKMLNYRVLFENGVVHEVLLLQRVMERSETVVKSSSTAHVHIWAKDAHDAIHEAKKKLPRSHTYVVELTPDQKTILSIRKSIDDEILSHTVEFRVTATSFQDVINIAKKRLK